MAGAGPALVVSEPSALISCLRVMQPFWEYESSWSGYSSLGQPARGFSSSQLVLRLGFLLIHRRPRWMLHHLGAVSLLLRRYVVPQKAKLPSAILRFDRGFSSLILLQLGHDSFSWCHRWMFCAMTMTRRHHHHHHSLRVEPFGFVPCDEGLLCLHQWTC